MHIKLEEHKKQSSKIEAAQTEIVKLQAELAKKAIESTKALAAQQKKCDEIESVGKKILETSTDYQAIQKQLEQIVIEGKAILYNQAQHQATQLALQNLEAQLTSYANLEADAALQAQRTEQTTELLQQATHQQKAKSGTDHQNRCLQITARQ